MFFWNSLAFSIIQRMLAIWSLVPLPFLKPAWTTGSSQFTYCWSLAWRILSITLLRWVQLCGSLNILWHCLSLGLEWKLTFSRLEETQAGIKIVFIGRTDAEAETPVLWPPHAKSWLIGKDPDAGRDWGQEEKGTPEDEMAGWHHWLNGRESEWTPGVGDEQGGLACCNSWGRKELDTTERLNWTELKSSESQRRKGLEK